MKNLLMDAAIGAAILFVTALTAALADGVPVAVAVASAATTVVTVVAKAVNPRDESYGLTSRE